MKKRIHFLVIILLGINLGLNAQSKDNSIKKNRIDNYKELVLKAKTAGLNKERLVELLGQVYQLDQALDANKLDSIPKRKNRQIRTEFDKKMVEFLNINEYNIIFGDRLKKVAEMYSKAELKIITGNYNLTENQKEQVYDLVSQFYLAETIGNFYYKDNKSMQREQLASLRVYYEKQYQSLMESYGFNIAPSKIVNTDAFLY